MLNYLFRAAESLDETVVIEQIQQLPDSKIKEIAMTAAERLEAKGFQKGKVEGIQEGEARGETKRTLKMLQLKFRSAAQPYADRVSAASQSELDLISERLLTAETIEQVFEGL